MKKDRTIPRMVACFISNFLKVFLLVVLCFGAGAATAGGKNHRAHNGTDAALPDFDARNLDQWGAFETTVAYVVQFYPLWFTFEQSKIAPANRLVGPDKISSLYHTVVAINDDTLYASSVIDLRDDAAILTIPETTARYSILSLDLYGNILQSGIQAGTPGTYGLISPGCPATLPPDVIPVQIPFDVSILIFRADKFSVNGEDQTDEAARFRESLRLATLSDYTNDYTTGATAVIPEILFAIPFKTIADNLVRYDPIEFLRQLQMAVGSDKTPPMSPYEALLAEKFDSLFGDGNLSAGTGLDQEDRIRFAEGARTAHGLIVDRYLGHTGPTNWINFLNIGNWGDRVIDRAAITEYIQFGNGHSTAAYYHAFKDGSGRALDAGRRNSHGYVLTFRWNQLPEADRFWSVTAYTPDAIELVPNAEHKYLVASYTPGLEYLRGSVSIYMAPDLPPGVPAANWLPVPPGPFNIMLRVYGPEGDVADGTYIPPAIKRIGRHWRR